MQINGERLNHWYLHPTVIDLWLLWRPSETPCQSKSLRAQRGNHESFGVHNFKRVEHTQQKGTRRFSTYKIGLNESNGRSDIMLAPLPVNATLYLPTIPKILPNKCSKS